MKDEQSIAISDELLRSNERFIKARFYRWVLESYGGKWDSVARDVKNHTGVDFDTDSLRQNIRPSNKKAGLGPRRFKDAQKLRALYEFTLHQRYISAAELDDSQRSATVAVTLNEFIDGNAAISKTDNLKIFNGAFQGQIENGDDIETFHLHIDYVKDDQIVRVYGMESIDGIADNAFDEKIVYEGWMVSNENRMGLIFMKHEYDGAHCYLLLQAYPSLGSGLPVTDLALLRYAGAWNRALNKVLSEETGVQETQLSLTGPLDRLCRFLTRID